MGNHHTDRLHALDGVRAYALILGVFLHATMAFLANLPPGLWVYTDTPSDTLAGVFFVIHMFRMSAFFLIAGFFARMVLERRGIGAFAKDRLKRIGIPLVIGLPIILATIIGAYIAAGLMVGIDLAAVAEAQTALQIPPGYFPWAHLWFLYYLLLFYAIALILRSILRVIDTQGALGRLADRLIAFILRDRAVVFGGGIWGVMILALPVAVYFYAMPSWGGWIGMPSSYVLYPQTHILLAYGVPFTFGWLAHRQISALLALEHQWRMYLVLAIVLTILCLSIAGLDPVFDGPYLLGTPRVIFTIAYMLGQWCWIFAFIGLAVRYWSDVNPWRRYLADSSYWLYLMHMTVIAFMHTLLGPLPWHWSVKYLLCVGVTLPVLIVSYHYLVRATWIGALLNGRRYPREWPSDRSKQDARAAGLT